MALMSSTTRGPLARRHITPMGASGIWRGVGNSPPVGFTDTLVVTYQGGSVTIPAEQPAAIYGTGGALTALDLSNHAYCLFIVPGIVQLFACRQQDYAGIWATDNVVPLVYLQGPHDLRLPPMVGRGATVIASDGSEVFLNLHTDGVPTTTTVAALSDGSERFLNLHTTGVPTTTTVPAITDGSEVFLNLHRAPITTVAAVSDGSEVFLNLHTP